MNYKTIYISGAVSNLDTKQVIEKFEQAEKSCRKMGFINIVNPLKLEHKSYHPLPWQMPLEWSDYMRTDIKALCQCQAIYILPCWQGSRGAHLEVSLARELQMEMIFEMNCVSK